MQTISGKVNWLQLMVLEANNLNIVTTGIKYNYNTNEIQNIEVIFKKWHFSKQIKLKR